MTLTGTILFIVIIAWVIARLQRDVSSGMRTIFALLVCLPFTLRFDAPGGLFQLTIHRILIVIAFIFLIRNRTSDREKWPIPNLRLVILFGVAQLMSFAFGTTFASGIKAILTYGIETALLYLLVSEYIQKENDLARFLSSICYGLAAVAAVAAIEKEFRFDLVTLISPSGGGSPLGTTGDVAATYPHRILMGYALAMGVPLSMALASYHKDRKPKCIMYGITLLLVAATYFSTSRGPWLGLTLGLIGVAVFGGRKVRKQIILLVGLAAVVLIVRPGVRETISNLYNATFDSDSAKGSSYDYRWQLWGVAWDKIRQSPVRFLFGCGPGSTEQMDLSYLWYGQEGSTTSVNLIGFTSWDNNYASDLVELGVLGFLSEVLLFLFIVKALVDNWRNSYGNARVLQGGVVVSCLVFMFAMTTVFIFAPQLKYLFWALVAVGSNFSRVAANQEAGEPDLQLDDPGEPMPQAAGLVGGEAAI